MTTILTPAEYHLTVEKIAKINARAAKKGWTGRVTLDAVETTITREVVPGFKTTEQAFEVTLGGEAPSYNGWSFVATLDWDNNAGLITRCAPGVEVVVERDSLTPGWCDHCRTTRDRKATYLVVNETTGQQLQVGSSCIKDFLGWSGHFTFLSDEDVKNEVEGGWGFSGGEREYSVDTILAIAWAAIKCYGFVPASSYDKMPTSATVRTFLNPRKGDERLVAEVGAQVDGSMAAAAKVRAFILSSDFSGTSEYIINLKAVTAAEFVSSRNFGLLASAPQAMARFEEQTLVRIAAQANPSTFIGTIGEKIEFAGTIEGVKYISSDYGTSVLYTIRNADTGIVVKWFASREALGDTTVKGTDVTIKGTVKKHEEFNGTKATLLTRCKAV